VPGLNKNNTTEPQRKYDFGKKILLQYLRSPSPGYFLLESAYESRVLPANSNYPTIQKETLNYNDLGLLVTGRFHNWSTQHQTVDTLWLGTRGVRGLIFSTPTPLLCFKTWLRLLV